MIPICRPALAAGDTKMLLFSKFISLKQGCASLEIRQTVQKLNPKLYHITGILIFTASHLTVKYSVMLRIGKLHITPLCLHFHVAKIKHRF